MHNRVATYARNEVIPMNQSWNIYQIEATDDARPGACAYILHGPKADYRLMRTMNNPHAFFVLNSNLRVSSVKGNYWFSDQDGKLVPVSR